MSESVHPSTADPVFDLQRFFDWDPWRTSAACRGVDPELFFPSGEGPKVQLVIEQARMVCRGCAVRVECATYALNTGEDYGIWGGLDESDRRRLRRARRVSA